MSLESTTKKTLNPSQKKQSRTKVGTFTLPWLNSTGFKVVIGCLAAAGFSGLFLFGDLSNMVSGSSHYSGNVFKIIHESLIQLSMLKGGYWMTIKCGVYFVAIASFIHGAGAVILRKFQSLEEPKTSLSIEQVLSWSLGFIVTALIWLGIGSLGFYRPVAAYVFAGTGAVLFLLNGPRVMLERWNCFLAELRWLEKILAGVLVLWVGSWWFTCFLPEVFWDSLIQHVGLPWLYAQQGRLFADPFNVFSYFPQNVEMLFTWTTLLRAEPLPRMLCWYFWVNCLLLVYGITLEFSKDPFYGIFAAGIVAFSPATYYQAFIAKNDLSLALLLACGMHVWAQGIGNYANRRPPWWSFFFAGILIGGGIGTKYIGLYSGIAIVLSTFFFLRGTFLEAMKSVSMVGFGIACSFGPWALRGFMVTGNPVYPYLSRWMHVVPVSPWHLTMSINTEPGWVEGFNGYTRYIKQCFGWGLCEFPRVIGPGAAFLIFGILCFFIDDVRIKAIMAAGSIGWTLFSLASLILRYQLAFLLLAAALSGVALSLFFGQDRRLKICGAALLLLSMFWKPNRIIYGNWAEMGVLAVLQGADLSLFTLNEGYSSDVAELHRVYDWIDINVPKNAVLLLVGESRIYKVPRRARYSSDHDVAWLVNAARRSNDTESLWRYIKSEGVSHLLVNLANWNSVYGSLNVKEQNMVNAFFSSHTQPLAKASNYSLLILL